MHIFKKDKYFQIIYSLDLDLLFIMSEDSVIADKQHNIGNLEDEALKRKEYLKALKRGDISGINTSTSTKNNEVNLPKPIFRNYTPKDDELKMNVLPKPKLIDIENEIKDQLENGQPQSLIEKEIDLATLAPQKIDWDLKRDVEKKLKILEKRTQRAIVDLIKERINQQKDNDLAELVSVVARTNIEKDLVKKNESSDEDD